MELKDTIELMTSTDYKERFKAEYYQLKIRFEKLSGTINDYQKGELAFKPTCPIEVLEKQCRYMQCYLGLLLRRAELENVDLDE